MTIAILKKGGVQIPKKVSDLKAMLQDFFESDFGKNLKF